MQTDRARKFFAGKKISYLHLSAYFLGAWSAETADQNQYIEIIFDDYDDTTVNYLTTQGHATEVEFVTSYKIKYLSSDQSTWQTITSNGNEVIFEGNFDQSTPRLHYMPPGVITRGLRLIPVTWSGWISLRWQLYGCYEKRKY